MSGTICVTLCSFTTTCRTRYYLGDMMRTLLEDGWNWVDVSHAFRDPVFKRQPKIVPAGESLVCALAKESRRFEGQLRYPGEDGEYEKAKMDALGL